MASCGKSFAYDLFRKSIAVKLKSYDSFNLKNDFSLQFIPIVKIVGSRSYHNDSHKQNRDASNYKKSNHNQSKHDKTEPTFSQMMAFRQQQAQCSILIDLTSRDETNHVAKICKDFGDVRSFVPYVCGYGNAHLLTEFAEETSIHKLLKECRFRNCLDTFPLYSRFVRYERRKGGSKAPSISINEYKPLKSTEIIDNSSCKVSQLMLKNYDESRLDELSSRLRFFFASTVQDALCSMFPYCSVLPFGSSVNSVGTLGCDLDLMIQLYPENISSRSDWMFQTKPNCDPRIIQQRTLNYLYEVIRNILPGINNITKIKHARVPILKFSHAILEFECDISINNMTAVFMSEILHFCGGLDYRVRPLVYAVRKWAKEANITYATPGSWITNFSLSLLVLFFLQNRPDPILPPLVKALNVRCFYDTAACSGIEYTEDPTKWRNMAQLNTESLGELLQEFLTFVSSFPFEQKLISILIGKGVSRQDSSAIWIQYPLEEDKNVSKNVSENELKQLQALAKMSSTHLDKALTLGVREDDDLLSSLGVYKIKKEEPQTINIDSLYAVDGETLRVS